MPLGNICHHYPTLSSLQEQYLPYILQAKLKLACSGEDLDPSLISFIETSLQHEERKALLEVWLHLVGVGLVYVSAEQLL